MPRIYSSPRINRLSSTTSSIPQSVAGAAAPQSASSTITMASTISVTNLNNISASKNHKSSRKGSNDSTSSNHSAVKDEFTAEKAEQPQLAATTTEEIEAVKSNNLVSEKIEQLEYSKATSISNDPKSIIPSEPKQLDRKLIDSFEKIIDPRSNSISPTRTPTIADKRKSLFSDVKQEVMAEDFQKMIKKLDMLTHRLELSVNKSENVVTAQAVLQKQLKEAAVSTEIVSQVETKVINTAESSVIKYSSSLEEDGKKANPTTPKTPVFELSDNNQWQIENLKNRDDLVIDKGVAKHSVFIHQCEDCKIKITSKVHSILIDSCRNVRLELESGVQTSVEVLDTNHVELKLNEEIAVISLNKVDKARIQLTKKSIHSVIESIKSYGITISVPSDDKNATAEPTEQLVPEKLKIIVNSKSRKLITTPIE